ncbi:nucleic acid/nucleotide deaminase domain-containing protein [Paenibacillus sp. IHBB 10380]|uniref:nucleic acid/nucleotide deaminase domain-containing protein n=1 Tax=Paenibacillus sp. IHBB 10380 TaxID=1566358 RepID=UPI0005CFBEB3|nr:hypothetical protein UB51_24790 [Paenibacillus sp. IHBB 10380]
MVRIPLLLTCFCYLRFLPVFQIFSQLLNTLKRNFLVDEKNAAEKNEQKYIVNRVYTEREPCNLGGHECKELLTNELPDTEVTYSFEYGDKASRYKRILP